MAAHMPPSWTPFSVWPLHFHDPKLIALKSGQAPPSGAGGAAVVDASSFSGFYWIQKYLEVFLRRVLLII